MFFPKILNSKIIVLSFLVSLLTMFIYFPALDNQFVTWDDPEYAYDNPHIRLFNVEFIKWAFSTFYFANWHPLTWISYAIDYSIWKSDPFGYHLTNVFLHGINTFLVVTIVFALWHEAVKLPENSSRPLQFKGYALSAVTGLLFGLHPVHVESVAWISERKDVLCACFFLLSIYLYIQYTKKPLSSQPASLIASFTSKYYIFTLLAFILSLLSKPMAVTLPAVLIILDFYPLNRIAKHSLKNIILEKLPFLLLSIGSSILTLLAQYSGGAVQSTTGSPLLVRTLVSFKSILLYIQNMLWPFLLLPFYPYPTDIHAISIVSIEYVLYLIVFIAFSSIFLFISLKKKKHVWLAAWSFYIIMLLPVLGLIKFGNQSMADRYTYLPSIGPFLIFSIGTVWLLDKLATFLRHDKAHKIIFSTFTILLSVLLSDLTLKQIQIWKNGETLWNKVLFNDITFVSAYLGRGRYYSQTNQWEKAIQDFTQAITLDPMTPKHYYFRGTSYLNTGHYEEALTDLTKAVQLSPESSYKHYTNRAIAFIRLNRFDEALSDYTKAINLNPNFPEIYYNRGNLHARLGLFDRALADYTQAIRLSPSPHPDYYYNRAVIYNKLGARAEAMRDYERAIQLKRSSLQ
jgi:protein O-mannosyl-transferase